MREFPGPPPTSSVYHLSSDARQLFTRKVVGHPVEAPTCCRLSLAGVQFSFKFAEFYPKFRDSESIIRPIFQIYVQLTPTTMVADNPSSSSAANQDSHRDSNKLFAIAEIEPWLYLCGAALVTGSNLRALGITCVVSAAPELPRLPLPPEVGRHCVVSVSDHLSSDLAPHLERVADLIQQVKNEGGKTLVHCVAGVSRSASLCLGYLVKYGGMTLAEAYHHVHSRRTCIRPNNSFFEQLISFEKRLLGATSVAMVYNLGARGIIPDVYESDYSASTTYFSRFIGAT